MTRWWATEEVLRLIHDERAAQFEQWGDQDIPIGGSRAQYGRMMGQYRERCQRKHAEGSLTYADVLLEEVFEALAEEDTDPAKQCDELVQVAAVAVKMAEMIKRKLPAATHPQPVQG